MREWQKEVHDLPDGHGFTARPGNNVFVAGRGDVQFEYPQSWIFLPQEGSARFHDRPPPDDDMVLEASYQVLNPAIDWRKLSLEAMVADLMKAEDAATADVPIYSRGLGVPEVTWAFRSFQDPEEKREAISLIAVARRIPIQVLVTGACWPEDLEVFKAVWQTIIDTIQLGMGPPARTRN